MNGAFGGLLAFAITVTLVPLWPAVILAALTSALVYAWFARPLAVFELDRHVLQMANRQLSFADLGMVHMIERRDEEPRGDRFFELLMGPRLRTRYEVYFRVRDEPLVLAQFSKKTTADRLVTEVRSLMGPPQ